MSQETDIVPASHGRAFRLKAGQLAQIINIYGNQVVDAWAVAEADPLETSSLDQTRSVNSNIFFMRGMALSSSRRRPMLTMVEDSAALRHDTLLCPCGRDLYLQLGCEASHRSCAGNFHEALAALDIALPFTPASLNLFMNVPVAADGTVDHLPPSSTAGDHVTLRAEMDLVLVLSACPQDVTPINGTERTPRDIAVRLLDVLPAPVSR